MITAEQIRAGLAMLRWSRGKLHEECSVPERTIQRIAEVSGVPKTNAQNLDAIQRALEAAGIDFLDATENHGAGIRFKEPG